MSPIVWLLIFGALLVVAALAVAPTGRNFTPKPTSQPRPTPPKAKVNLDLAAKNGELGVALVDALLREDELREALGNLLACFDGLDDLDVESLGMKRMSVAVVDARKTLAASAEADAALSRATHSSRKPKGSTDLLRRLYLDWHLYGEVHVTNANGVTRLDPRGIKYTPPEETQARTRRHWEEMMAEESRAIARQFNEDAMRLPPATGDAFREEPPA